MKSLKLSGLIFLLACLAQGLQAQKSIRDSTISLFNIGFVYNGSGPGGDLAERFGFTNQIGMEATYKLNNNFYFTGGFRFLFGNTLRERVAAGVTQLVGSDDTGFGVQAIGADGRFYQVRLWERGFVIPLTAGKIFSINPKHNPNSGIFVEAGAQFIQHKVKIDVVGGGVPNLAGDYIPGYDRLTNGIGIVEALGYRYYSNKKLLNFQVGFEFSQNFTESRRDFNFDLGRRDDRKRMDLLYGFRIGWVFPIYQDAATEDYFY